MIMNSEQDFEDLSTSECHNSEHNSMLLVLETFLKEKYLAISYAVKKEKYEVVKHRRSLSCL